jgi:peptide/nickel transport system ATP-binding protein
MTPLLSLRGLTVIYPGRVTAVRGVDLDLAAGEILGVAGESGSGTSTMVLAALRLLEPDVRITGDVLLDGADLLPMPWGRLRALRWATMAITLQGTDLLNPVRRVGAQIAEPLRLHAVVPRREIADRVADLLRLVGLPAAAARAHPHQLSGGEIQRVTLAMALACEPRLLVVDESTTGLDLVTRADVLDVLTNLAASGVAVLMVSHDLPMLASVSHRLAVMYAGRLVEHGPTAGVLAGSGHPYTRGLIEAAGVLGDPRSRRRPRGLPGAPPDPARPEPGCAFRARCAVAADDCAEVPAARPVSAGHRVACHRVPG